MEASNRLLQDVETYYTEKVRLHGASAKGVDWNSEASQELRFSQLLKIIKDPVNEFSLLDYGCGYGAMLGFMNPLYPAMRYTGFDISGEMIKKAKEQQYARNADWVTFLEGETYDYVIASGIFNVKLGQLNDDWKQYVEKLLIDLNRYSTKGFSFNMLTSFSDIEFMREYLYYADPGYYFNFCKINFSKHVALLHDYPLYEFTVIVKKEL